MFGSKKNEIRSGLKIIIVGCGKVGSTLAEQLSGEGHDITMIDQNRQKLQNLTNFLDVMAIEGNGASFSTQISAGIKDADLMIAVTDSDELNLLCCILAKQESGCSAIARVRTPDYSKELNYLRETLGLAMIINPDYEASKEIVDLLCLPDALEVNSFAHGQVELVNYKIEEDNILNGVVISELHKKIGMRMLICVLERNGDVIIPNGDVRLESGDIISFVVNRKESKPLFDAIDLNTVIVRDCIIVGGGRSAVYLALGLISRGVQVKIIEKDTARCEELSILLPKATIINGDGSDEEILKEEGVETVESFIPLTGIDEENILLTLFVKQISQAKVVTKINRINFKGVVSKLDLGSIVYPKYIVAEEILAYARAKNNSGDGPIETLYHLYDGKVEALEFKIDKPSAVTDVPLMNLPLKQDVLIAVINRGGNIIIPSGSDMITPGDTVIVVTKQLGFNNIIDILR